MTTIPGEWVKPLGNALRLEIASDPAPGQIVNLVQNPSGELGSWGWQTPVVGSILTGVLDGAGSPWLVYVSPGGVPSFFYSEPIPVAAGQYVSASWLDDDDTSSGRDRGRFEYLDADKVKLTTNGESVQSAYNDADGTPSTYNIGPFQAPAGTAYVRLRFDHYANTSGGNPVAETGMQVKQVTVAAAATSTALGTQRINLIPNPSGESGINGWIEDGSYPGSIVQGAAGQVGTKSVQLSGPEYVGAITANQIPVTPGATYTLSAWARVSSLYEDRTNIVLLHALLNGDPINRQGINWYRTELVANTWLRKSVTFTVPSTVTFLLLNAYTGDDMTASEYAQIDGIMLEQASALGTYFDGDTTNTADTTHAWANRAPVVKTRTNLVINPSFETNVTGWAAATDEGMASAIARITTQHSVGVAALQIGSTTTSSAAAYSSAIAVTAGLSYAVRADLDQAAAAVTESYLMIKWYSTTDGTGTSLKSDTVASGVRSGGWYSLSGVFVAPTGAKSARLRVYFFGAKVAAAGYVDAVLFEQATEVGAYFDGATANPAAAHFKTTTHAWTGTANASTSTETVTETLPYSTANTSKLAYVSPIPWVNILGPTHDLTITREALNVGTLTANIIDAALDPSVSTLIRPGRALRLMTYSTADARWRHVFTGMVSAASVEYELADPDASKRAHIELTAVDNAHALANQTRAEGVGTIDELAYLMEGKGVPWNVNGSGRQPEGTPTWVAFNENASLLDQVAITRDSVHGFAWVDRMGVLQAWDKAKMPTARTGQPLTESVYKDVQVGYNSDDVINEVMIKFQRFNPSTNETEEVPYGPWRNEDSIKVWGVHSSEFVLQGVAEETSALQEFADEVLAANATPTVRLNSMVLNVDLNDDYSGIRSDCWYALIELYALVEVTCARANINAQKSYVTGIKHTISGPESKWMMELSFTASTAVASPTQTPSPPTGTEGKTIGQLLRPVGEVTMWYGSKAQCPAGWLVCDGTAVPAEYTELIALIGPTLPNFTDRMAVGAGTKALGTSGGAATKAVPPHDHSMSHSHSVTTHNHTHAAGGLAVAVTNDRAAGTGARGGNPVSGSTASDGGETVNTGGSSAADTGAASGSAFDVMNPWRAVWFIIRAR